MSIIRKAGIILFGIVFFMSCAHNTGDTRDPQSNVTAKRPPLEKRSRASDFY